MDIKKTSLENKEKEKKTGNSKNPVQKSGEASKTTAIKKSPAK